MVFWSALRRWGEKAVATGMLYNPRLSMARQMDAAPDPFRFVLGQPMVAVPGEDWH
jgi:hypothetical protein